MTGNNLLHIIDFADPENAANIDHVTLFDKEGDGVICDVTTCKVTSIARAFFHFLV